MPCHSTIEGEPELYPRHQGQPVILYYINPYCTVTLVLWQETSQWKQNLDGTHQCLADCQGSIQQVSCQHHEGETATHSHYACISSCLVSDPYAIILTITLAHVSSLQHKIGDQYQACCTTCKTHAMATSHGGAGCPWIEVKASSQKIQNTPILTMTAPTV